MKIVAFLVISLAAVAAGWKYVDSGSVSAAEISPDALYTVRRGKLVITVAENGYLKAKNSETLMPKFEREGTITWLIDEGEEVDEQDILVEFDKTDLTNQVNELQTSLIQFEMELEAGRAQLGIQERDNQASVEKAELALELKSLALERYEKGDWPNERRKLELAKDKAQSEYERAIERYEQVPELQKEGFLTKIQAEEERIRKEEAKINFETAELDLELFDTYTHRMDLTTKKSEVKDATRELENAQIKATISLKEKQALVKQQERAVSSTTTRIEQLEVELANMTLRAPKKGIVHYGDPNRPWYREQIKVGNRLHRGNTVITLPDLSVMQVLIQVHEADIGLVQVDMPVFVTVETHKGRTFPAKVTDIATVASSQSWDDSTNKTFRVEVTMDPIEIEMRAGTTAKAEVQVEELPDVLQVPIHAVFPENGKHFCYVLEDDDVERREVDVGKNNAHHVVVLSGLDAGDQVLLYDPDDAKMREVDPGEGDDDEDAGGLGAAIGAL